MVKVDKTKAMTAATGLTTIKAPGIWGRVVIGLGGLGGVLFIVNPRIN